MEYSDVILDEMIDWFNGVSPVFRATKNQIKNVTVIDLSYYSDCKHKPVARLSKYGFGTVIPMTYGDEELTALDAMKGCLRTNG